MKLNLQLNISIEVDESKIENLTEIDLTEAFEQNVADISGAKYKLTDGINHEIILYEGEFSDEETEIYRHILGRKIEA